MSTYNGITVTGNQKPVEVFRVFAQSGGQTLWLGGATSELRDVIQRISSVVNGYIGTDPLSGNPRFEVSENEYYLVSDDKLNSYRKQLMRLPGVTQEMIQGFEERAVRPFARGDD